MLACSLSLVCVFQGTAWCPRSASHEALSGSRAIVHGQMPARAAICVEWRGPTSLLPKNCRPRACSSSCAATHAQLGIHHCRRNTMAKARQRARKDVHATITQNIIDAIEKGQTTNELPWRTNRFLPIRYTERRAYRGVNVLNLWAESMLRGYSSLIGQGSTPGRR